MAKRKTARQIAAAKRNLAKARAKKNRFHAKNRKKINSKRVRKKGLVEYKKTGLVTTTSSKTWRGAVKKMKKGSRMNKRYGKKLAKHRKRVAKYQRRSR